MSKFSPGCGCCSSAECTCDFCDGETNNAPCCLTVRFAGFSNAAPETFPCFHCELFNGTFYLSGFTNANPCRWQGLLCSLEQPYDICGAKFIFVELGEVSGGYILTVRLMINSSTSVAVFQKNYGEAKPSCKNWNDEEIPFFSGDGNCAVDSSCFISRVPAGEYCPSVVTSCSACSWPNPFGGYPPQVNVGPDAFEVTFDGMANDGCADCESFLNGRSFILTRAGGFGYSCNWKWTASTASALCADDCEDGGSDMCLNYVKLVLTADPIGGTVVGTITAGRSSLFGGDTPYVEFTKTLCTSCATFSGGELACLDLDETAWVVTDLEESRDGCDWSEASVRLRTLPFTIFCGERPQLCQLCEGFTGPDHWQITIPTGHWNTDCSHTTGATCSDAEGTFILDRDPFALCTWMYYFSDCTGGAECKCCWESLSVSLYDTGTGIRVSVVLAMFCNSCAWQIELPYAHDPSSGDPKYIDCTLGGEPLEVPYCGRNGLPALCFWDSDPINLAGGPCDPGAATRASIILEAL